MAVLRRGLVIRGTLPLERTFQRRVLAALHKLPNTFYYKAQAVSIGGIPDVIVCIRGQFIGLELKRDQSCKATPLQEYTLKTIRESGGIGLTVNPQNWQVIHDLLIQISEGETNVKDRLQDIAL